MKANKKLIRISCEANLCFVRDLIVGISKNSFKFIPSNKQYDKRTSLGKLLTVVKTSEKETQAHFEFIMQCIKWNMQVLYFKFSYYFRVRNLVSLRFILVYIIRRLKYL